MGHGHALIGCFSMVVGPLTARKPGGEKGKRRPTKYQLVNLGFAQSVPQIFNWYYVELL